LKKAWISLKLIVAAVRDLLIPFLPTVVVRLLIKNASYAFLIHPRDLSDVERKYPFLRRLSPGFTEKIIRYLWPIVGSRIAGLRSISGSNRRNSDSVLTGYIVICPLSAKQMHQDQKLAQRRILQTVRLAEKLGCKIIGLGALSASMTQGGEYLLDKVRIGITSGHAYTVAVICEMVEQIAKQLAVDLNNLTVAVVGAAGYIGVPCSRIISKKKVGHLILIDRVTKVGRLEKLYKEIANTNQITLSTNLMSLRLADIVVVVTNSLDILIKADHLKPGAVVLDDSQPRNTSMELMDQRPDVLILDVVANAPGVNAHFSFDFPFPDDVFTCMGETLILAARGWKDNYCVGEFDYGLVNQILRWGDTLNFSIGKFRSFNQLASPTKLDHIKSFYKDRSVISGPVAEVAERVKKVSNDLWT
jgi:predicted amino acid dehydrogenase